MVFTPVQTNMMPRSQKVKNLMWKAVNTTIFRISPPYFSVFRKMRVALLRMFGAKVDWNASIHPSAKIEYPWNLTMGALSSLGENVWAYAMAPIIVGEKTCIGKDTYLITGSHNIYSNRFELVVKPITIGSCCWITTGVTVLQGVTLADFCVVGANSTVTKNVEPWSVVGGNPAKFIKKREIHNA